MKKYNKIHYKDIFVIIFILQLIIIFNIQLHHETVEKNQKEERKIEYMDIISKKQNEILNLKEQSIKVNKTGSYNEPYIPNGFHYVEGNFNDGYVIEDKIGNQFVWIPCRNYINDDILELKRYNFDISENLSIIESFEDKENLKEFIESVGKYEGFYIARYEAGNENNIVVSKKGAEIYSNVNYEEAVELSKGMYQNDEVSSNLINGLAWDTMLKWIDRTTNSKFSSKGSYTANYSNTLQKAGYDSINRIYDLSGNAIEWTTEKAYDYCIFRGEYSFKDGRYAKIAPGCRDIISKDNKYKNLGFRVIMYAK